MYNNKNSTSNAENDKTDSWSFSFDYQRFSNKNKPKSLLGRRTLAQIFPPKNESDRNDGKVTSCSRPSAPERTPLKFQNLNGPSSLTHPVNPNVTPVHKFSHPSFDNQLVLSKKDSHSKEQSGKTCQRGLGFSTPFRLKECQQPLKDGSSPGKIKVEDDKSKTDGKRDKEITKDLSSIFANSNIANKDLNTSFICEDTYPLPEDSLSSEADQQIKSCTTDKTIDSSHTDNINNSCFMTAHEIHPTDLNSFRCNEFNFKTPRRNQDSFCLKTPGRNFTLFSVSQSPIDPLAGILNEDNDSFNSDSSLCSPLKKNRDSINKNHNIDLCQSASKKDSKKNSDEDLVPDGKSGEIIEVEKTEIPENCGNKSPQTESDIRSVSLETFATQCEVTQINAELHQVDRSKNKQNPVSVVDENKSTALVAKTSTEQPSSNEPKQELNNCRASSIPKYPSAIVTNQNHHVYSVNNSHPLQIPVDPFIQSKLIKPQPQNILYVNNKPYAALSLLGRGGSSEVYQVLEENSSRLLAIKCVNLATVEDSTAHGYLNEIELLSKLQCCPSVIKMLDHEYVESKKMLYVVMEKGDIDFSKLIKDITKIKKIPMSMIIYYWTEMLTAVKDIHDKGVIHSDLKPGNFLLVCGRLKLIDFGIASALQGDMTSVEKDVIRGTFNYISPEAISAGENRFHKISYKSDVWSLGCILYNLLFGCTPFSHITSTLGKFQAIADPNFKIKFPTEISNVPPALKLSLRWCLIKDAKSRPTVDRLLKLSEHAIRVPQIDSLWYQCVIKEFPDCCVPLEDLGV